MGEKKINRGLGRRSFLGDMGTGLGSIALAQLLNSQGLLAAEDKGEQPGEKNPIRPVIDPRKPFAPRQPHFKPRARNVVVIFCAGGCSHLDTFDYKPKMYPLDGKTIEVKTFGRGGKKNGGRVVGPKWKFKQYGQCGKHISDLFPHLGQQADKIAFLH